MNIFDNFLTYKFDFMCYLNIDYVFDRNEGKYVNQAKYNMK